MYNLLVEEVKKQEVKKRNRRIVIVHNRRDIGCFWGCKVLIYCPNFANCCSNLHKSNKFYSQNLYWISLHPQLLRELLTTFMTKLYYNDESVVQIDNAMVSFLNINTVLKRVQPRRSNG